MFDRKYVTKQRASQIAGAGCILLALTMAGACATSALQTSKLRRDLYPVALEFYGNKRSAALEVAAIGPILRNPKLYDRVQKLRWGPGDAGGPVTLEQADVATLTALGLARLDRDEQAAILELKRIMAETSPALCAGFWTGEVPDAAARAGMRGLSEEQQRTWIVLTARALSREIEAEAPLPPIADADSEQAITALAESLPPVEQQALISAAQAQKPSSWVACGAFRAVAAGVRNLPSDQQQTVIRLISEPNLVGS